MEEIRLKITLDQAKTLRGLLAEFVQADGIGLDSKLVAQRFYDRIDIAIERRITAEFLRSFTSPSDSEEF